MFKTEIRFDRSILEAEGYDYENAMNLLCENFKRAGFIEELNEEAHLIFRGTDSPKDFSYMGLVNMALAKQQWFKNCVTEWLLLSNNCVGSNGFECVGDFIETGKRLGRWYS